MMVNLEKRLNVINDNRLIALRALGYTLTYAHRPLSLGHITSLINEQLFEVDNRTIYFHVTTSGDELLDAIIRHLNVEVYEGCFKIVEKMYKVDAIKQVIDNGFKKMVRNNASSEDSLSTLREKIRRLEDQIGFYKKEMVNISNPKPVSLDYERLMSMNNVNIERVNNEELVVTITAPLTIYNREEARVLFNSHSNKTLKKIFIHRSKVVYFTNKFLINVRTNYVNSYNNDRKGNPHISRYDCWGNYRNSAKVALYSHDFMKTIMYLNSAVSTLTLSDSTVLNSFMNILNSGDYTIKEVKR